MELICRQIHGYLLYGRGTSMNIFMIHSGVLNINSGGGIHFIEIFNNLKEENNVCCFVGKPVGVHNFPKNENNIVSIPYCSFLTQITYQFFLFFYLCYYCLKKNPDIFYVRQSPLTFSPLLVSKLFKIPHIIEINGLPIEDLQMRLESSHVYLFYLIKYIYKFNSLISYKYVDKIIIVTRGIMSEIKKNYKIQDNKTVVIENGTNTKLFRKLYRNECIDKLNISRSCTYICFVGELSPWHGVEYLIESLPFIIQKFHNIKLLIIGDGPMKKTLVSVGKNNNVLSNIIFTGVVPHEEVPYYINASDVCVAPFVKKRNEKTGISPLKIYEYLACEKPVISSRIKNLEFIQRESVGALVEPEKPLELANAIIHLLNNEKLRYQMGKNGRIYVETNHSWKIAAKKLNMVCEEVISG